MNRKRKQSKAPKKKRRKLFLMFLATFSVLFLVSATYAMIQYETGRSTADNQISNEIVESTNLNSDNEFIANEPENNEPINVLFIGVDTDEGQKARTDTIMIAQYDPNQGDAKIASIMRDTYVEIPGYSNNKINASFFLGGPELLRQTIEENFDMDIHYYAMVNFDGFVKVVDTIAPDGLAIDIKKRMYYQDNAADMLIDFKPGLQALDGKEALKYVRFRNDGYNDYGRVERQQEVLTLLKDELLTVSGIARVPRLIGSVEPYIDTNIKTSKMLSIGRDFILNPVKEVETLRIPVDGGFTERRYSVGDVLELDFEKNREALHSFFSSSNQSVATEQPSDLEEDS